jgi:cardiolipin synthase
MGFWILLALWLAGWTCIPHLLLLNKRPTATLAWLWALVLFPVVGPLLYLAVGSERVKRARTRRREKFRSRDQRQAGRERAFKAWKLHLKKEPLPPQDLALFEGMSAITRLPGATADALKILRKAPAFYEALKKDIEEAKIYIHVEVYIFRPDEVGRGFLQLLADAAQRGVTVRLLVDELGSLWTRESFFQPLRDAGGEFSWCHTLSPLRNRYSFNLRNHRKLQVIDGAISYVGGINFGREYLGLDPVDGHWSDTQIRMEGTVTGVFEEVFAEDWYFATGDDCVQDTPVPKDIPAESSPVQILRGGPDEEDHPMLRVNLGLVAEARERLWIATGYFVPGEVMQTALQVAAARGVDVRLLISSKNQHPLLVRAGRSYYDALLRQGVKIYEYSRGVEHSKYIIIDREWSSVGSSNFDERSMRLNFELSILARNAKTNQQLAAIFKETIDASREIDRKAFNRRPYRDKLIESAMRPLSPVL